MPEVSVITPAFRPKNVSAYLAAMAANADVDAEWIVVDDGSGPGYGPAWAAIEAAGALLHRLPENRGQAAARNAGLALAQGDWIKFLDADDGLDSGHLATLLTAGRQLCGSAVPFAPTLHVWPNGKRVANDSWRGLPADPTVQLARILPSPFLTHCGVLFPRSLLQQFGGYDETLATDEDGDLLIRTLLEGAYFVAVPEVRYLYIHHGGTNRVSSDNDGRKLSARRQVCDKLVRYYATRGIEIPAPVRQGLAQRLDKIAMAYCSSQPSEAQALLAEARALYPGYRPPARGPVRILRRLVGPAAADALIRQVRRLRGRAPGGMQG